VVIALGLLEGVDPGWGDQFGVAVGAESDLPAAVVDLVVVVVAEQGAVGQGRFAASIQWVMWWPWHRAGGRVQPGNTQPASRATRAAQIAGVMVRDSRPTARGTPRVSVMIGVMPASQAIRRTVSMVRFSPVAVRP
jgi:hypothetical protein